MLGSTRNTFANNWRHSLGDCQAPDLNSCVPSRMLLFDSGVSPSELAGPPTLKMAILQVMPCVPFVVLRKVTLKAIGIPMLGTGGSVRIAVT